MLNVFGVVFHVVVLLCDNNANSLRLLRFTLLISHFRCGHSLLFSLWDPGLQYSFDELRAIFTEVAQVSLASVDDLKAPLSLGFWFFAFRVVPITLVSAPSFSAGCSLW